MGKRQAGDGTVALRCCSLRIFIGVFVLGVVVATPEIARTQTPAEKDSSAQHPKFLWFGDPKQTGENQIMVPLEFAPDGEYSKTTDISTQIPLPEGPWRFLKADSPKGSRFKVSTRLQREEETTSDGEKHQTTILYFNVSGGERTIPAGVVAQLSFIQLTAGTPPPIVLALRSVMVQLAPEYAGQEPPQLEPPAAGPSANPAPTCFFFAH